MSSKKSQAKKKQAKLVKPEPKEEKKPISPEKQKFLDRCAKRTVVRQKLELARLRRKRKTGINFVSMGGDAPCAFMVERVKKEEEKVANQPLASN